MTKTATAEDWHDYHDERWEKMPFEVRVFHQINYLIEVVGMEKSTAMRLIDGETPPKYLAVDLSVSCPPSAEKIDDDYLYDR